MTTVIKNRYEFNSLSDIIGSGSFGEVYKAKDKVTNDVVVIKAVYLGRPNIPMDKLE